MRLEFTKSKWNATGIMRQDCDQQPIFETEMGQLYHGDCLEVLSATSDGVIDTVFADPPFNLRKRYGDDCTDDMMEAQYVEWCRAWIDECVRVLKPGGAFFLYNLPKWNILLASHLIEREMQFRHWIAISSKTVLPIPRRLYPAHYSLLYFTKGKPKTFRNIRTPIQTCRHCSKEIKDYGGHRAAMNPNGVNLTDVWDDIPPVRHRKFKSKKRTQNQLSTKLVRRCVELTTEPGEVVLDPFGGAGTTYDVCEQASRHWVGIEIQHCDVIIERLEDADLRHHEFTDYVEGDRRSMPGQKKTHVTNKNGRVNGS